MAADRDKTPRFGPPRGELLFRLWVSLGGLALMLGALAFRGIPTGPALIEVVGIAGLFFGCTAVLSARGLVKHRHDAD